MSWAGRRKALIITIIALVVVAFLAVVTIAVVYKAPTCTDQKQNQDEEGVDCGGSCAYLCTAAQITPTVRFVRALSPVAGRYDVIAYIDNHNQASAAKGVRYTVELYDADHGKIASAMGTFDLPADTTVPIYLPNVYHGTAVVTQAFLTIDTDSYRWYTVKTKHLVPTVSNIVLSNTTTPRITAVLANPTAYPLYNVTPIVVVFDADNNAVAASQTFIPQISAQGSAQALFAWNAPFAGTPVKVEILPITPLSYP
jgi:hypothetical protein